MLITALQLNAQQKRPNILVIFGDDIGCWNVSACSQGMMHYKTPNIDRLAQRREVAGDVNHLWVKPLA